VRDAAEIERAITAFARSRNSGLIVTGSAGATVHRNLIITLAAQHKLPAVYFERNDSPQPRTFSGNVPRSKRMRLRTRRKRTIGLAFHREEPPTSVAD
jgi:putative ABC transport system substrate-binding protein